MNTKRIAKEAPFHRIKDPNFRTAFCLKPGFNYSALKPYCKDVKFATDGFKTDVQDISRQLSEAFSGYDPSEDCIIPTGTAITNMMTGYLLNMIFPDSSIAIGFYLKEYTSPSGAAIPEDYNFYRFYPHLLLER